MKSVESTLESELGVLGDLQCDSSLSQYVST